MPGDALFASVGLLLDGDGANNSTVFTDRSRNARTVTVGGNTKVTTTSPKYGTGAIAFDGTGDYFQVNGLAFGTGDFCVELDIWFNDFVKATPIIWGNRVVAPTKAIVLYRSGANVVSVFADGADRLTSSALVANTWYHMAVTREAGVTRFFLNGVQQGGTYTDTNNYDHQTIRWGMLETSTVGNEVLGKMDNVRVTIGAARYTAAFTPPAAAHPTYAGEISGVVLDEAGAPAARVVRAHRRSDGTLVGSTTSSAVDGSYAIQAPTLDECTVLFLDDATSDPLLNDLCHRVVPA